MGYNPKINETGEYQSYPEDSLSPYIEWNNDERYESKDE